jgi:hypothetical protein
MLRVDEKAPDNADAHHATPTRRRRRWRRWLVSLLILLVIAFIGAELFARFYLGLGDPPLSIADPQIEYLFKPSQEVMRFGNRVAYNAYSMRSADFPQRKTDPNELRVMVIGDSVVNGGSQTDQSQIATTILQRQLSENLNRPVVVGNISAGSWGPANMLAYVKRFGLFDADIVIIVLSSHDYGDAPQYKPVVGIQPEFPDRRPLLAVQEGFGRYLLPRLRAGASGNASVPADDSPEQSEIDVSLKSLRELIDTARASGARVIVAQYLERKEHDAGPLPGHAMIGRVSRDAGAEVVQLGPAFAEALKRGEEPYRDALHPNAVGQRVMAEVMLPQLLEAVDSSR